MANEEKHSRNRNKSLHARKESKGEVSVRSGDAQSSLSIRLFGPFEMLLGGRPLSRLTRRKSPAILAMLAVRQGSETERDAGNLSTSTLWAIEPAMVPAISLKASARQFHHNHDPHFHSRQSGA